MNFDFKALLNLEQTYGKKLVTIFYYVMTVAIAVNALLNFIGGIANVANGLVLSGLIDIVFCLPLAVIYFIILRVVCELVNTIFEHCGK